MRVADLRQVEHDRIRKAFRLFDENNTGFIPSSELGNALRWLCLIPSEREVKLFQWELDPDETGWISWQGFLKVAARIWWPAQTLVTCIWEAFLVFDDKTTGHISSELLKNILTKVGREPIPIKEAEKIIKRYGRKDGIFPYISFIRDFTK
ncbi:unnamed protein product [Echinostoma caproni]|uniref:EF-hand domain-containing protein n=1 Tax=Echinostoma caproni TaxID=27848 RepID=A0A183A7J3_9TREM|nr:unnamed protein product [Echinostoma caproni]